LNFRHISQSAETLPNQLFKDGQFHREMERKVTEPGSYRQSTNPI